MKRIHWPALIAYAISAAGILAGPVGVAVVGAKTAAAIALGGQLLQAAMHSVVKPKSSKQP